MVSIAPSLTGSLGLNGNTTGQFAFKDVLTGINAFYAKDDYVESTKRDFSASKALPPVYVYNTQSKVARVAIALFSIIIFPLFLYTLIHSAAGKYAGILPASTPALSRGSFNYAEIQRSKIDLDSDWKYKRFSIEVNGDLVDVVVTGKASTFENGKWVIDSNGNSEWYEEKLQNPIYKQFLNGTRSNGIVFNYRGVGASSGLPNRFAMKNAYQAILSFLENEIGAKQIIAKGFSIGGGVQGDALNGYTLKKDVKYVFIKIKTFSDLASAASYFIHPILGSLVRLIGWNMGSLESSKKIKAHEIIIQRARVDEPEEIDDPSLICHDGIIAKEASLAYALLKEGSCSKKNKTVIGVPSTHNQDGDYAKILLKKVEECLS